MPTQLRWYVHEYKYSTWDSRYDVWQQQTMSSSPVLQFFNGDNWVDVPVVTEVTYEGQSNE